MVYCGGTQERNAHTTMIVSVTEVESYKRCRRQWDIGSFNRQGLTPIIQPKPYLDLGTMIHKSLAYWTHNPTDNLEIIFTAIASQHRATVISKYQQATGHKPSESELEPLLDATILGRAMMANYQEHHGTPLPAHMTFCAPEQEILIPIPGTEGACKSCDGSGTRIDVTAEQVLEECPDCNGMGVERHYLKARLDGLAQDTQNNIYIIEHKTYDKRPNMLLLEASDQFIGYMWVAQQLDIGYVAGIAYDGMWKRATPPQRPKRLELADLFVRTIISLSQDEVNEYGKELAITVNEMANDPYIYKNRTWQGCWDCSFEYLCRQMSQGGDVQTVIETQYMRRTEDDISDIAEQVAAGS